MKQEMISNLSIFEEDIENLCKFLYENPEDSYNEEKACKYICNLLNKHNFSTKYNFLDIPNSFYASKGNGHPKICFLCDYDAIHDRGHITGHNALTTTSCTAAICLGSIINKLDHGSVIIIGCPGEYLGGTKDVFAKQGVFDDIDVVMVAHPDVVTCESGTSSAIIPLSIKFTGSDGLSFLHDESYTSLDALLLSLNIINSLRKGFPKGVELNSVLSKGGTTPLLVPIESEAQFFIRAENMALASVVEKKIRDVACYVSKLTDIDTSFSFYETPSEELITNRTLNRLYSHNLKECGIIDICPPRDIKAALSLGTISKKVPCIHPYFSIVENDSIKYGTEDFAKATISDFAFKKYRKAALALAFTGFDIMTSEVLLSDVKNEFFDKEH